MSSRRPSERSVNHRASSHVGRANPNAMALDMTKERIRKLFTNVELSVSSYDTAWVAMVPSPNSPKSPCFPDCLNWTLMDNQPCAWSAGGLQAFFRDGVGHSYLIRSKCHELRIVRFRTQSGYVSAPVAHRFANRDANSIEPNRTENRRRWNRELNLKET